MWPFRTAICTANPPQTQPLQALRGMGMRGCGWLDDFLRFLPRVLNPALHSIAPPRHSAGGLRRPSMTQQRKQDSQNQRDQQQQQQEEQQRNQNQQQGWQDEEE